MNKDEESERLWEQRKANKFKKNITKYKENIKEKVLFEQMKKGVKIESIENFNNITPMQRGRMIEITPELRHAFEQLYNNCTPEKKKDV